MRIDNSTPTNKHDRQYASDGNRFFYNTLNSDYDGNLSAATWKLDSDGLTFAGRAPCTIQAGTQRLRTGYNQRGVTADTSIHEQDEPRGRR